MADCDFKIDENNQFVLEEGELVCVEGDELIAQDIRILLRTFLGEWFLDNSKGIDYINIVFVKNPSFSAIQSEITSKVLLVDGVQSIVEYTQTLDSLNRSLTVSFTVITETNSEVPIEVTV